MAIKLVAMKYVLCAVVNVANGIRVLRRNPRVEKKRFSPHTSGENLRRGDNVLVVSKSGEPKMWVSR